jgi:hypothetical protein
MLKTVFLTSKTRDGGAEGRDESHFKQILIKFAEVFLTASQICPNLVPNLFFLYIKRVLNEEPARDVIIKFSNSHDEK